MSDLPLFQKRPKEKVMPFAMNAFTNGGKSSFARLEAFDDGHFRAIFRKSYFVLQGDNTEPTKSQWNTLKKHIKRMNRSVFIFKEYGEFDEDHYYLDFGFFLD